MKRIIPVLFIVLFLLSTGCKQATLDKNETTNESDPVASAIIFADGAAVSRALNSGTYTNIVSGIGDGAVTYSSGTPATATVDASTGAVTLVSVGTTVITANKAATATHSAVSASYTLTVENAAATYEFLTAYWITGQTFPNTALATTPIDGGLVNFNQLLTPTSFNNLIFLNTKGDRDMRFRHNLIEGNAVNYNSSSFNSNGTIFPTVGEMLVGDTSVYVAVPITNTNVPTENFTISVCFQVKTSARGSTDSKIAIVGSNDVLLNIKTVDSTLVGDTSLRTITWTGARTGLTSIRIYWIRGENSIGGGLDVKSITINPITTVPMYSIIYNANNATSGFVPSEQIKTQGIDIVLASNTGVLARTGYEFLGWNTSANGMGRDYEVGAAYSADFPLVLFAKWVSIFYTTFDSQEATVPAIPEKTRGILPTIPEKTGYAFGGWYTEPGGNGTKFTETSSITADMTLYAKWIPVTCETINEMIYNGDFVNGNDSWGYSLLEGATADIIFSDNQLHIKNGNRGSKDWHIQLRNDRTFPIPANSAFKVSLYASSSNPADSISVHVNECGTDVTGDGTFGSVYHRETFTLSADLKEYSFIFIMPQDYNDPTGNLTVNIGTTTGTVVFDSISMKRIGTFSPPEQPEMVYNGDFAFGNFFWKCYTGHPDSWRALTTFNNAFQLQSLGSGYRFQLHSENKSLERNKSYEISFDALSTVADDQIQLRITEDAVDINSDGSIWTTWDEKRINLTTQKESYSLILNMSVDWDDPAGRLSFFFNDTKGTVTLNNVSMKKID